MNIIREILKTKKYTDCHLTIKCTDQKIVHFDVHKLVLIQSEYFIGLFNNTKAEVYIDEKKNIMSEYKIEVPFNSNIINNVIQHLYNNIFYDDDDDDNHNIYTEDDIKVYDFLLCDEKIYLKLLTGIIEKLKITDNNMLNAINDSPLINEKYKNFIKNYIEQDFETHIYENEKKIIINVFNQKEIKYNNMIFSNYITHDYTYNEYGFWLNIRYEDEPKYSQTNIYSTKTIRADIRIILYDKLKLNMIETYCQNRSTLRMIDEYTDNKNNIYIIDIPCPAKQEYKSGELIYMRSRCGTISNIDKSNLKGIFMITLFDD